MSNNKVIWANQYVDYDKLSPTQKEACDICREISKQHCGIAPYIETVYGVEVWAQDGKDLKRQVLEILNKRKALENQQ